ncbi:MAG: CHASE domain-containing protein [Halopseudomonas sp.]
MKFKKVEWASLIWAAITVFVLILLMLLDISRQREALQLESRVVYEFAYERALINEVILHNFVELVETDYTNIAAITRYSRELRDHYLHLRRLQVYQRVDADQRDEHEQGMREKGFEDYSIHRAELSEGQSETKAYSQSVFYPIIFVEPMNEYGAQLLGSDGYSIPANQKALIQASYYFSVFATDPYPLEDGKMGYRLMHALDPNYTDSAEPSLIIGLVLSVDELLPPIPHIKQGVSVTLFDGEGVELVRRDNASVFGGWLLPIIEEQRSITRFGQSMEMRVKQQLLWRDTNWPFGLIVLMFSLVAYLVSAQGYRRRREAERELLNLNTRLRDERDQLEQRVLERTQELVARNSELRQQVKENSLLIQKVLEIQETERRNIARELHDEMGQSLTAIRTDARLLQQYTDRDRSSIVHTAAVAIDTTAQRIYSVTYGLMRALRPSALDDLGLVDAVKQCVDSLNLDSQGIELHLQLSGALNELPEPICIQCYRIVQEALNNCVKYAQADNLWLSVRLEEGETFLLVVRIEDDGIGFDPKNQDSGFGLIGMRERALAHDGQFEVGSTPGRGTWIQVELPVEQLEYND